MIDYVSEKPINNSAQMYSTTYRAIMSSKLSASKKLEALATFLDFGLYNKEIPDSDTNAVLSVIYISNKELFTSMKEKYLKDKKDGARGGAPEETSADDVIKLKEQGLSNKDISKKLECSVRTVQRKLRTRGENIETEEEDITT